MKKKKHQEQWLYSSIPIYVHIFHADQILNGHILWWFIGSESEERARSAGTDSSSWAGADTLQHGSSSSSCPLTLLMLSLSRLLPGFGSPPACLPACLPACSPPLRPPRPLHHMKSLFHFYVSLSLSLSRSRSRSRSLSVRLWLTLAMSHGEGGLKWQWLSTAGLPPSLGLLDVAQPIWRHASLLQCKCQPCCNHCPVLPGAFISTATSSHGRFYAWLLWNMGLMDLH